MKIFFTLNPVHHQAERLGAIWEDSSLCQKEKSTQDTWTDNCNFKMFFLNIVPLGNPHSSSWLHVFTGSFAHSFLLDFDQQDKLKFDLSFASIALYSSDSSGP